MSFFVWIDPLIVLNKERALQRFSCRYKLFIQTNHHPYYHVGYASTSYTGQGDSQVRSFLAALFVHEPRTSFAYSITVTHMLSHIIMKVSGFSFMNI
jgi:hypothetical protein